MRAASWLRDGRRFAEEDLEASEADCEAAEVFELIAGSGGRLWWRAVAHNNCDVPHWEPQL
jgi:hypothetical protein